jgi:amino acid transporter
MPKSRLGTLRVACLALMAASVVLGLIVLVTTAIPLRQTDPVAAGLAFLLAVIAFVLAGVGVALAALSRRNCSRPPPPTGEDSP